MVGRARDGPARPPIITTTGHTHHNSKTPPNNPNPNAPPRRTPRPSWCSAPRRTRPCRTSWPLRTGRRRERPWRRRPSGAGGASPPVLLYNFVFGLYVLGWAWGLCDLGGGWVLGRCVKWYVHRERRGDIPVPSTHHRKRTILKNHTHNIRTSLPPLWALRASISAISSTPFFRARLGTPSYSSTAMLATSCCCLPSSSYVVCGVCIGCWMLACPASGRRWSWEGDGRTDGRHGPCTTGGPPSSCIRRRPPRTGGDRPSRASPRWSRPRRRRSRTGGPPPRPRACPRSRWIGRRLLLVCFGCGKFGWGWVGGLVVCGGVICIIHTLYNIHCGPSSRTEDVLGLRELDHLRERLHRLGQVLLHRVAPAFMCLNRCCYVMCAMCYLCA